jgi:hypothetical protein
VNSVIILGLDSELNDIKATREERIAMGSRSSLDLIVSGEVPASDEIREMAKRILEADDQANSRWSSE